MVALSQRFSNAEVYKSVLTAFFGFFWFSNLALHAISEFDSARHFTVGDVFFEENEVQLLVKWSKTIQYRDEYKLVALPKLGASPVCPSRALKNVMNLYNPGKISPLFQIKAAAGWQVLTDTRIRKNFAKINQTLYRPHFQVLRCLLSV